MTTKYTLPLVPHYSTGGVETIDFVAAKLTQEQFKGFCIGSAMLYLSRANWKGTPVKDIRKAVDFLNFYIRKEEHNARG